MSDDDVDLAHFAAVDDPVRQEAQRREAYRTLFGTALGKAVLLDILIDAGVAAHQGPPDGIPGSRDYRAGHMDRAHEIMDLAGVDPRHALMALSNGNEGYLYDRPEHEPEL